MVLIASMIEISASYRYMVEMKFLLREGHSCVPIVNILDMPIVD